MKANNFTRFITLAALLLGVALTGSVRTSGADHPKDIVDTAVAAGQFNTLATALEAAGLVETLKGKGPFTVFAPTDEAFAKLPAGTVEELLKPENKAKLTAILTYHVVSGKVMAADVVKLKSAKTVNGQMVKISAKKGTDAFTVTGKSTSGSITQSVSGSVRVQ